MALPRVEYPESILKLRLAKERVDLCSTYQYQDGELLYKK